MEIHSIQPKDTIGELIYAWKFEFSDETSIILQV
jgi:hypothetical protein